MPAPQVVVAGLAGPSAAILVTRLPPAAPLSAEDPAVDSQVRELWGHAAGCAARGSRTARSTSSTWGGTNEPIGPATVIDDFAMASVSAPDTRLDQDVAQLLVATASLIGDAAATPPRST